MNAIEIIKSHPTSGNKVQAEIDLRLAKQEFSGKLDEVFTLYRHKSVNGFGMVAIYYELHSNKKGLDSVFTIDNYQNPKDLKQEIIKCLTLVTNQYFRP